MNPKESPSVKNISQAKLYLIKITNNLKQLNKIKNELNKSPDVNHEEIEEIKKTTDHLLNCLENSPLTKFRQIIKNRQKFRRKKKLKRKDTNNLKHVIDVQQKEIGSTKPKQTTNESSFSNIQQESSNFSGINNSTNANNLSKNSKLPHHQLHQIHYAQHFLRTFELLTHLHFARGQDAEATQQFSAKLNTLRTKWNKILEENKPEQTKQFKIENDWNEVFFGPKEKLFYDASKNKLSGFLRKRRIWDSYIKDDDDTGKNSCIPIGWVLPKKQPSEQWLKYRQL